MSNFKVLKEVELFYNDIEELLKRLNYPIKKHDCTDIVMLNNMFVGAFNLTSFAPLGIKTLRVNWLAVTKESEDKKLHVGSFIMSKVIEIAKISCVEEIFISVNQENKRAIELYERFGFKVVKKEAAEQDMKLIIVKKP